MIASPNPQEREALTLTTLRSTVAAAVLAAAPISTAPHTGFDVPWGCEVVIESVIESRKRYIEDPVGEFTGHYPGGGGCR